MFTAENAAMYARKSHAPDSARHKQKLALAAIADPPQEFGDVLAAELSRVQTELVSQMRGNKDAAEVSKLSRALKDVREVYHLVTGQAKPGVIRETGRSSRQRSQAKPQPLPDDGPESSNP